MSCVDELESGFSADCDIGNFVTIGQGAVLTSCIIQDGTVIGAGAIIQEGSIVEGGCVVGPGQF